MVSAMKKALHKLIALFTAVCLCTSMVPATAFGAGNSVGTSASGLQQFQPGEEMNGQKTATATSDVAFFLRDDSFTFKDATESRSFSTPQQAMDLTKADATGQNAGPLTATFTGGDGSYEYLWTLVDVEYDENGKEVEKPHNVDSLTFTGPSNNPEGGGAFGTIDEDGNRTGKFVKGQVTTDATFTHSITEADGLEQDKTYRYTLYIATDSPTRMEARAQMLVSIYEGYKLMSLYVEGNGSLPPSVRGSLFTQGLPNPIMPTLSADSVASTDPIYNQLTQAAAPSQAITEPVKLVLTDLEDKPGDKDAYIGELKVFLPLTNENLAGLKEGDTVSVFHYDPATGEVKERIATVERQKDANGNDVADSEGNPVLVAQLGVTGGSTDLGTFAVGYKVERGTFNVQSSAGEGGTISPVGANSYPVPSTEVAEGDPAWPDFILYPMDGYRIKGVSLTRNGVAVTTATGSLVGNTFTFDPSLYTIERGDNWTVEAQFEKPTGLEAQYSVTGTLKGVGNGTMTFASAAPGLNPVEVAMGQTRPDTGEELFMMPSTAGVNVFFNPGDGHRLKSFTINGTPYSVNGSSYYISVLDQNMDLVAEYEEGQPSTVVMRKVNFEVEDGESGHGTIGLDDGSFGTSGSREVNFGGSTTLTLKPDEQYVVSKVMAYKLDASGNPLTPGTELTGVQDQTNQEVYNLQVNNVLQDMKIVVTFGLSDATVDIKNLKVDGGTVNYAGPQTLAAGKVLHLVITPNAPDYEIGKVTFNGEDVSGKLTNRGTYSTVNLARAVSNDPGYGTNDDGTTDNVILVDKASNTFEVDFNPVTTPAPSYVTITTVVADPGGGKVTPTQEVLSGQDVDIFFFPDENKTIGSVDVDGQDMTTAVNADGKLTLPNVLNNTTVTVTFTDGNSPLSKKKRYTLHPSAGLGGSISPSEEVLVYEGQSQKFTFRPSTGYELSTIRVDGVVQDLTKEEFNKDKLTYTVVPEGDKLDVNVWGSFAKSDISGDEKPTYTVDISAGQNGAVSPSGLVTVARGSLLPITILPKEGYHVAAVWQGEKGATDAQLIDRVGGVTNGVYSLYDVQADMVIKVEFAEGEEPGQPSIGDENLIKLGTENYGADGAITITPTIEGSVFFKEEGTDHASVPLELTIQVATGNKLGTIYLDDEEVQATEVEPGIYRLVISKEKVTQDMYLYVGASPEPPSTEKVPQFKITLDVTGTGKGSISPQGISNIVYVEKGTSQTFTFIPESGNKVGTVKVNNKSVTFGTKEFDQGGGQKAVGYFYTFPAVNQDSRLEVEFVEDPSAPPTVTPYDVSVNIVPGDNSKDNGTASVSAAKVLPGNSLGITFQPDPGYETHVYKGSTKEDCTAANEVTSELEGGTLTVGPVESDLQYVVWFQPKGQTTVYHTVTAMEAENGSILPPGRTQVQDGGELTIALEGADNAYVPDEVYITRGNGAPEEIWAAQGGTDVEIIGAASFVIKNITTDVVIEAKFKPGTPEVRLVPIKVTPSSGGTVSPTEGKAEPGTPFTITITPDHGYELKKLTNAVGGGSPQDVTGDVTGGTYTFTVTSNPADYQAGHVIEATFEQVETPTPDREYYLVHINPGANGTASPRGEVKVPAGGSVPFTIIPDEGYKVKHIVVTSDSNSTGTMTSGNRFSHTLFSVNEDMNVNIEFEPLAGGEVINRPTFHTISASAGANGSVSPAGDIQVEEGKMAMFTFKPDDGYRLSYLTVDGEDVPPSALSSAGQYIFSGVKKDHTIHGVFIEKDVTADNFVTVNAVGSDGGTISPLGAKLVWKGKSAAYTIAAHFGYELTDIQLKYGVNGRPESIFPDNGAGGKNTGNISTSRFTWANGTLTLLNLQEDTNILASFKKTETPGDQPQVRYTTIKMSVGANGSTSLPNGVNVIEALPMNGTMNVSVIPNEGYAVDSVDFTYANGTTHTTTAAEAKAIWTNGYFTLTEAQVNYQCSITVAFRTQTEDEKKQIENGTLTPAKFRTITASSLGKGQITPRGAVKVATTASITFSMIPTEGYELAALKVNGADAMGSLSGSRSYTFQPGTADQSIQASFSQIKGSDEGVSYVLVAKTQGSGGAKGTVSVESQKILAGGSGVVYFIPNDGSKLVRVGVSVNGAPEVYTEQQTPEFRISNITADTTVTGYFELGDSPVKVTPKDMDITVASSGGMVSPSGTPAAKVPAGAEQVINLFPDAGYEIDFIRVNEEVNYITASIRSYSVIADPSAEKTVVEVYYKKIEGEAEDVTITTKVTATVNGAAGGATVYPPQQTVPVGTPVTFYVKAADGKTIYAVYVDKNGKKHFIAFKGVTGKNPESLNGDQYWSSIGQQAQSSQVSGEERAAAAAGLYSGGAMAAPALYRGGADLTAVDYGENGPVESSPDKKYYEYYEITIPPELLAELMDPVTGEILIDIEMRDITEAETQDPDFEFITTTLYGAGIWTGNTGGMVQPSGEGIMDWGSKQNVHITAFAGYYVDYITRTYTYGTEKVTEEIPYSGGVSSGNVMIEFGEGTNYNPDTGAGREPDRMDINVYFRPLGEASFVTVELGTVTGPNGTISNDKVTVKPALVDENGNPKEFIRDVTGTGETETFIFETAEKGPNGEELILESVYYNGKPVAIVPGTNMVNVHLTANGKFDVKFRPVEPNEVIQKPEMFTVEGKVISGQGTVSSTLKSKGSTAQIGFKPADGYILDQENSFDYYADDPSGATMTKHALDPKGLSNADGVYNIFNIDRNHRVELAFVESVEVEIKWDTNDGYVSPNTMNGGPLKWKKGRALEYIVAPYVGFNVKSFDVTTNGVESSKMTQLTQSTTTTNTLHNKMAANGYGFTVQNTINGAGVSVASGASAAEAAQGAQPVAQAERAENGTFYGASPLMTDQEARPLKDFNYAYGYIAPVMANTYTRATWTEEVKPEKERRTINIEIVPDGGGYLNGSVEPMVGYGVDGDTIYFTVKPDWGYQLGDVYSANNRQINPVQEGLQQFAYGPISGNDTIYVKFVPVGSGEDWFTRALRTLKALAQTGDLTAPLVGGLVLIAVIGFTGAAISSRRSRKKQQAR